MKALLEMEEVTKSYRVGGEVVKALDGVNLKIHPGEYIAVIGPSGSGKSTLMHLLGFLDQPTSGKMHFEGKDVSQLWPNQRARIRAEKIGFVFQSFNLLPRLTVRQNVMLPHYYCHRRDATVKERVKQSLLTVGMADRSGHRPNQLSGGQKQRAAIARALTNSPSLILADEPTGNLDSITAGTILDLFLDLNQQGRTIILVTHDASIAARTRRQIHVKDGKILEDTGA